VATVQADQLAEFFAAVGNRTKPDLDVVTRRDVVERMHLCSSEPEAVTYAEVDAGGVPAVWCAPAGCPNDTVMLWNHAGGSVVFSMHSDRRIAGHLAKAANIRALVLDFRRSPEDKFPAQQDDVETAYRWLLAQGYRPDKIASGGHSIGGNLAVSLAIRLRDKGMPLPAAILSASAFLDFEFTNQTLETGAETDKNLSVPLLKFFRESWLGGTETAYDDPRVNLLYADLAGCRRSISITASTKSWPAPWSSSRTARRRQASTWASIPSQQDSIFFFSAPGGSPRRTRPLLRWAVGCDRSWAWASRRCPSADGPRTPGRLDEVVVPGRRRGAFGEHQGRKSCVR
jgi:acetyl esterase/lipase